MITIGADIRVLGQLGAGGIKEYASQVLAHMTVLDRSVRWKLFWAGRHTPPVEPWMTGPSVSMHGAGISNRLFWGVTRLAGRPFIDRIIGGADVFFFPHFLLAGLSPACRRVMTWHDLSYEAMPELFGFRRRVWHQVQMQPRRQARESDRIIAVSQSTADDVVSHYGVEPGRVTVVHSGIAPSVVRPEEGDLERFRARTGLPRRFVLALGAREPRKNLEALVAAFEIAAAGSATDAHLILAGPSGWLSGSLERRIRVSPLRSRIRMTGPISDAERPFWLSAAHVLAYPSLMEGFGFPPLEAMACGTPVLASANSSMLETLGDAALMVDPYSVASITSALGAIMEDDTLRARLVRRGRERADTFSWPRAAEQTLDAILSTTGVRSA